MLNYYYSIKLLSNFFKFMKVVFIFLWIGTLSLWATDVHSQNATIRILDHQELTVEKFIREVESQTNYLFVYSKSDISANERISLPAQELSVKRALENISKDVGFSYFFNNDYIVLTKRELAPELTTAAVLQGITITGTVTDSDNELLPGVNVVLKDTQQGTVTDANGVYSITVPNTNAVLLFSFVGFNTYEIPVGDRQMIDVMLSEDAMQIQEVVVVGYGTQKKVNLSGAVDAVGSEVFEGRSLSNTTQALQGAVPNLNITLIDGKPNRTATFNVRGTTSIGQGGSALVLIDGVEGDPSFLNPNDIESVSVLKDAASAAIYGARGSFGVVLITTKSPQKGKTTVNYTGNFSIQSLAKRPEFVINSVTWLENFRNATVAYNGTVPTTINACQYYSDAWLERMRAWKASGEGPKTEILPNGDWEHYYEVDWMNMAFKDRSFVQDHNLSISGSNEKGDFYVSGRSYETDGLYNFDPDIYRSYNLRAKGALQAYKWLRVHTNMEYAKTTYHQALTINGRGPGLLRLIQGVGFPTQPLYNPDGTFTRSTAETYAGFIEKSNYQDITRNLFRNTLGFSTNFFDNTFRINGDYTFRYDTFDFFSKLTKAGATYSATQPEPYYYGTILGSIDEYFDHTFYTASNLYAEYENTFVQKHYVKALAGWNYETSTYRVQQLVRNDLLLDGAESVQLATGANINPYYAYTRWRTAGAFFRLNYGYRDRYLLEVNGRYDGSSRFPTDQQWGFFPSISGAWRLSEESFWNVNPNIFSDVKFRASYGSLGNGNIAPYRYLEMLSVSNSGRVLDGELPKRTSVPTPIPDGLTWEKATTTDFGLDFGMLKGRLRFSGDYYVRKTTDMYTVGPALPVVFGAASPQGNYADMTTKGYELSLTWQDKVMVANKPLSYHIRATFHDYVSKIDKFNNPEKLISQNYAGRVVGELWGFRADGLFQTDPDPSEYVNTFHTPALDGVWRAGDIKIKNLDNSPDNRITTGASTVDNPGDRTIIGNTQPRYQYSFSMNADWNGIFISAFFQGVGRRDWIPGYESLFWGQYNRPNSNMPAWHLDQVWSPDNPDAFLPRLIAYSFNGGYGDGAIDRYTFNVGYLLLKNLQIGYTLPDALASKIGMKRANIYLSGENLATWSPLYKVTGRHYTDVITAANWSDGDVNSTYNQGTGNAYPMLKTFSLGVSLTF